MTCLTVCSVLFVGFVIGCEGAYLLGRKTTRAEARADCVIFLRKIGISSRSNYWLLSDMQRSELAPYTINDCAWKAIERSGDALESVSDELLWREK